jgi:hypothetical protein
VLGIVSVLPDFADAWPEVARLAGRIAIWPNTDESRLASNRWLVSALERSADSRKTLRGVRKVPIVLQKSADDLSWLRENPFER